MTDDTNDNQTEGAVRTRTKAKPEPKAYLLALGQLPLDQKREVVQELLGVRYTLGKDEDFTLEHRFMDADGLAKGTVFCAADAEGAFPVTAIVL